MCEFYVIHYYELASQRPIRVLLLWEKLFAGLIDLPRNRDRNSKAMGVFGIEPRRGKPKVKVTDPRVLGHECHFKTQLPPEKYQNDTRLQHSQRAGLAEFQKSMSKVMIYQRIHLVSDSLDDQREDDERHPYSVDFVE